MEYLQGRYRISRIRPGCMFDFTLECPELAKQAKAGQFVHIQVPGLSRGFSLRRPISICETDHQSWIRILFDIRGEGTRVLAEAKEGDYLDLMGPLGNGFALLEPEKKAVVIGGGIGVPPMLETAKHYGKNAVALLGFRDKDRVILTEDFQNAGVQVQLASDDGSVGHHGLVTALLAQELQAGKPDIVYACGPKVMLKAVAALCAQAGVRCQVSLEERMGCGVGACLVCACKTRKPDGGETYSHVCKNGPVFEAEEVIFDE